MNTRLNTLVSLSSTMIIQNRIGRMANLENGFRLGIFGLMKIVTIETTKDEQMKTFAIKAKPRDSIKAIHFGKMSKVKKAEMIRSKPNNINTKS